MDRVIASKLARLELGEPLRVLDLFAGSGALGLAALSRGAAHATFIEKSRPAIVALRSNIKKRTALLGNDNANSDSNH